eukprot:815838_1
MSSQSCRSFTVIVNIMAFIIGIAIAIPAQGQKHHVMIANINSRGRSNQLFSIAEALLLSDDYFITFLIPGDVVHYLDEFKIRYPPQEHRDKYQIIASAPTAPVFDPLTLKQFADLYVQLITNSFYTSYPVLHYYMNHCDGFYQMQTIIDDYTKYHVSLNHDAIRFLPIDVILGDWLNLPILHLAKMHNIRTVVLQTAYHMSFESRFHLYESSIITSKRFFNNLPYPEYTFLQDLENVLHRFALSIIEYYVAYRTNTILANEFNIPPEHHISHLFDPFSHSLILKSMGPPVCTKEMYTSQKYQFAGFLLPKHLDKEKPWLDPAIVKMHQSVAFDDVIQWMDSQQNIIYIAFGTVVKADPVTINFFHFLMDEVFTDEYLALDNKSVLWAISDAVKEEVFGNVTKERVLFRSWLPQKELLHHANVKLFITHGGASSTMEAVHAAKPLLYASFGMEERFGNALQLTKTGCADFVDLNHFSWVNVQHQIYHLLTNPYHAEKCKQLKGMMRFFGGTNKAVQVIEYVIQWGGMNLMPEVMLGDLSWYQRTNVHIYLMVVVLLYCVYIFGKWVLRCAFIFFKSLNQCLCKKKTTVREKEE